jgi:hypothetical protein
MKANVMFEGQMYEVDFEEIGPSIYVYKNALPEEMKIIDRVENALAIPGTRFQWQRAQTGFEQISDWRTCMDWKIKDTTLQPRDQFSADIIDLHDEIIRSLKICLEHYKPLNYLAEISYFEAINVVRYGPGQFFKVHTDDGDPYRCTLSAVGYPNDNYAGGELKFPKFNNLTYKPKAGDFVLFPSAYSYAHSSEPITDDGVKYSLVIMTDRNEFANRKDSPVLYDPQLLRNNGFKVHGI